MKALLRLALPLLLLIGLAPAATARSEESCRAPTSPRVAIEAVQADIQRWFGRCVRLAGIRYGNRLLIDREAMLEAEQATDDEIRRSIVIYPMHDLVFDLPSSAARVEILGRVSSCSAHHEATAAYAEQHPDMIVWTSGFCHTSSENYVRPTDIRLLSRRPIARLSEADVPHQRRELVEVPPELALRADLIAAARALAVAIASSDDATFLRLTNAYAADEQDKLAGSPEPEWLTEQRREARQQLRRLQALGSPFRTTRVLESRPHVLVARSALEEGFGEDGPNELVVCWCRGPDCAGRWPVMLRDADARRDRPYACVQVDDHVFAGGAGRVIQASVADEDEDFAEPVWPSAAPADALSP